MSIIKLNNRSVKDITSFGSISSLGSLTHIATQTASSSSSLSFTSGIDSTYKEYIFYFVNIHPQNNAVYFQFNLSTDGGSNYNVTKTSTFFSAYNYEQISASQLSYRTADDLAQSTSDQRLVDFENLSNDNDHGLCGTLHLFNPASTFVKHFISTQQFMASYGSRQTFIGGYFNTTNAITRLRFKFNSGNIDSGQILLFGLN